MNADLNLFNAAQIPVDSLRYKHENNTQKMLRNTSKQRKEEKSKAIIAINARLQKTWPDQQSL